MARPFTPDVYFGQKPYKKYTASHYKAPRQRRSRLLSTLYTIIGLGLLANGVGWGGVYLKQQIQNEKRAAIAAYLQSPSTQRLAETAKIFPPGSFRVDDADRFQYILVDKHGQETDVTQASGNIHPAVQHFKATLAHMLQNRPDLLYRMNQVGVIYKFYIDQTSIHISQSEKAGGLATDCVPNTTNPLRVEIAAKYLEYVPSITRHEIGHILECLYYTHPNPKESETHKANFDAFLPEWNDTQIQQYKEAREIEKQKIREKRSPIWDYALKSDHEFLAVLIEAYINQPEALLASNASLYQLMDDYFHIPPDNKIFWETLDTHAH